MSNKAPMTNLGNLPAGRQGWILEIRNFFLDTLFPITCLSCQKDGTWLCDECLEKIPLRAEQVCPLCEKKITPQGKICFECRKKYSLDGLLVSSFYSEKLVSKMIHLYKYRFAEDLRLPLGKLILKATGTSELALPEVIIPVPLHLRRLRWRGFNQAQLLSQYLGENLTPGFSLPVLENLLIRQKHTRSQMKIKDHKKRRENMEGAFAINKQARKQIIGKNIWLVDDVATTGSTLFECAKVLKKSGAASVFGIVIARQEFKTKG